MKIYLRENDANTGPFDEAAVRARLVDGTLTPDVYAWREGMADWRPLGEVLAAAPVAAPIPVTTPLPQMAPAGGTGGMPWWAKTLLGCGALALAIVIAAAACVVFVVYRAERSEKPASLPAIAMHSETSTGGFGKGGEQTDFQKEVAEAEAKTKKEQEDIQAEIDKDTADPEHYTVETRTNPDGGKTTVITPKANTPGGKPLTRTVDADGKITTVTVDTDGNTVTRTLDKNGNTSTVTTPKGG